MEESEGNLAHHSALLHTFYSAPSFPTFSGQGMEGGKWADDGGYHPANLLLEMAVSRSDLESWSGP